MLSSVPTPRKGACCRHQNDARPAPRSLGSPLSRLFYFTLSHTTRAFPHHQAREERVIRYHQIISLANLFLLIISLTSLSPRATSKLRNLEPLPLLRRLSISLYLGGVETSNLYLLYDVFLSLSLSPRRQTSKRRTSYLLSRKL
jgi:hypothetical protein